MNWQSLSRPRALVAVLLVLAAYLPTTRATTWYCGVGGSLTNGTYVAPWSVEFAVGKTPNNLLRPGDTVIFKNGGTYVCAETNSVYSTAQVLEFRVSGTPGAKITYRSESLWGFSFDGGLLFPSSVSNLVIRNLRISYSGSTARVRTNAYTHPSGIAHYGEGIDLLHNLIENTGHPGIGSWKSTRGKYIAGNIIRFVGFDDYTGGYSGANRGSGMYLQNADNSAEALIAGNISYFNYTTGMKAYGNADIWKFTFQDQICTENAEAGIFYHLDNYGSTNLTVRNNYLWRNGTGIRLGYPLGNGGHSNAVVTGNYVVDKGVSSFPFYQADGWTGNTWSNNVGVTLVDRYIWQLELMGETNGDVASHHIDSNTYYATNTGAFGPGQFSIKDVGKTFEEWKAAIRGDTNSAFIYGFPTNVVVHAFAPSTDADFVHVAVFNWPTNASVAVDLNPYFRTGDSLRLYDAQAIPTAYTNLTFTGSLVFLDLSRTNIAPMLGSFAQRPDTWSGFDRRFRAFVIHRYPSPPAAPSAPANLHVVN